MTGLRLSIPGSATAAFLTDDEPPAGLAQKGVRFGTLLDEHDVELLTAPRLVQDLPRSGALITAGALYCQRAFCKWPPVPDYQIACWMVITQDGRFAYTSKADSQTISGYRIAADGTISLLDANGGTNTTASDTFPLEEVLTRNSRFLYELDWRRLLPVPGPVTLSGWQIDQDEQLTSVVNPAQINLPFAP